jgi:hypothetical protein
MPIHGGYLSLKTKPESILSTSLLIFWTIVIFSLNALAYFNEKNSALAEIFLYKAEHYVMY